MSYGVPIKEYLKCYFIPQTFENIEKAAALKTFNEIICDNEDPPNLKDMLNPDLTVELIEKTINFSSEGEKLVFDIRKRFHITNKGYRELSMNYTERELKLLVEELKK